MNRFGVLNLLVAIGLIASVTAIDCNNRPDFSNAKDCCPHEFITSEIAESCKDLKEEGKGGGGGPRKGPHGPHGHNSCYGECIMNKTQFLNFETMVVDEAKAKAYVDKVFVDAPDFGPVISDAITKCAEKGKEMRALHANDARPSPPPGSCKPCAGMFLHCLKMETDINCPTSVWKNDEACNNIREFLMVCKQKGPPK